MHDLLAVPGVAPPVAVSAASLPLMRVICACHPDIIALAWVIRLSSGSSDSGKSR
jgi:hypothetical protein